MSTVLTAQEPSAKYLVNLQPPLVRHFDLIAQAPGGVARLRELILTFAVQGKLVPQDPSETLVDISVIPAAINRLIGEGKVPRSRTSAEDEQAAIFDELPAGWVAVTASNVFVPRSGNSKLIKGKLFPESAKHLYPGYSASGQDVWLPHFEYEGTAVILSAVGARCGKAFLAKGKWSAIANTHIIWPLLDLVLPEYSMLLLNNEDYWIRSGGAQPFVKVTETLRQQVFLPPLAEQSRIVTRVEELMQLCDALDANCQLEVQQHAQLVNTLLSTLTQSETQEALADSWQRIATHFDMLLDRPEAVDALEQTILQLAVRGLLVTQDPNDEPASVLLQKVRTEKDHLIAQGKIKRDKPLPPITDEEKPFELPPGWEWVTIDALASVGTGTTPSRDNPAFFEGGAIPWVTSGETGQPFIRQTEQHVTDAALTQTSLTIYPVGTLVVAMYGQGKTRGQISELCIPATTNQACAAIVLIEPSMAHKDYVKLVFEKSYDEIRELSAGGAQPNLNVGKVKATLIPLPPLDEQNRIVTCVNTLRELFTELRRCLTACHVNQAQLAHVLAASN